MIMGPATRLTIEEFLNLPGAPGKRELLDGELIALPPAELSHMQIAIRLHLMLMAALSESRARIQAGYQLNRGCLQPDVSVTWPDQPVENGWLQRAPMIAIEIVSGANLPEHIDKKTAVYLEEGAAEVWVIYPGTRRMTVFREESWERVTGSYIGGLLDVVVDLRVLIPNVA
jgi:Uma2 family endonuclease